MAKGKAADFYTGICGNQRYFLISQQTVLLPVPSWLFMEGTYDARHQGVSIGNVSDYLPTV